MARSQGVTKVFISGITIRKGSHYGSRASAINKILEDGCRQRGFIFIDNSNIGRGELNGELHLNDEGTLILKSNFVNKLY